MIDEMLKEKRYSIVLRGRVQDVGFRSRIISTARIYGLRGYPPINDIDGSVKMICEGSEKQLDRFLKDIDIRKETPVGIRVEVLEKKELPLDFPLPLVFAPVEVEEIRELSRKMDVGNERLKSIEENTTVLGDMDAKLDTLGDIKKLLEKIATK